MVKERRPLYDKTRPEYSDRDIKERCWREIASEYGAGTTGKIALCCFSRCSSVDDVCCFAVRQVKEEWRRLRTKFVKEKAKKKLPSGSEATWSKKWHYYDAMSFVGPYVQPRR